MQAFRSCGFSPNINITKNVILSKLDIIIFAMFMLGFELLHIQRRPIYHDENRYVDQWR